jgi:aspartyl-tRNA(Asn)/glutamyl-tRNA(Gln) amidotransferase subunit C
MSNINEKEVLHIAKLAELEFDGEQLDKITDQLDKILSHVAKISQADTTGCVPMSHALDVKNVFRHDKAEPSLSHADALKNAPEESGGGFLVPKID